MRTCVLAAILAMSACKKDEVKPDASVTAPAPVAAKVEEAPKPVENTATGRVIDMQVTAEGFVPANVKVKANEALTLRITRKTDETCATEILIEGTDINVKLPLEKTVSVNWTPTKAGAVKYGCAMDKMVGGVLLVE